MPLAITALDVAFVSALAAVSSPIAAFFIARGSRTHERDLARDSRDFEARKEVYFHFLNLVHTKALVLLRLHQRSEKLPQAPGDDEWMRISAQVACFGSDSVRRWADEFDRSWAAADALIDHDEAASEDEKAAVARVRSVLVELEREVRLELTGE